MRRPKRLYLRVTNAIAKAEKFERQRRLRDAAAAYAEVSRIEEAIAKVIPADDPEGAIAREGSVRAALGAADPLRARELAQYYIDAGGPSDLLRVLKTLRGQARRRIRAVTPPAREFRIRAVPVKRGGGRVTTAADLAIGAIVEGPLLPEPVEVLATQPMGASIKLLGRGVRTNQVHQPVLDAEQIAQLSVTPKPRRITGRAITCGSG